MKFKLMMTTVALASSVAQAQYLPGALPQNFPFSGKLTDTSGVPLVSPLVRFEIWDMAINCRMYVEEQSLSPHNVTGEFSTQVGSPVGSSARKAGEDAGYAWADIFQNTKPLAGATGCAGGKAANLGEGRKLRVIVNGQQFDDINLNPSVSATVAETVQGKRPGDFVNLRADGTHALTQSNAELIFENTNFASLTDLIGGTSNLYLKSTPMAPIGFNNQRLTNIATPTAADDAATKGYADSYIAGTNASISGVAMGVGGGKVLMWNQSTARWEASAATDPTKLPLTGGTVTGYLYLGTTANFMPGRFNSTQESSLTGTLGAGDEGMLWYNVDSDILRFWNGSAAVNVGGGGGGITALTGEVTASGPGSAAAVITNSAITTPKLFTNPGPNRIVATDSSTGTTLAPFVCVLGETLVWSASGWSCASGAASGVLQGGNSFGAPMRIGTNDNFSFLFKTNGVDRAALDSNGRLGLGLTSPLTKLYVLGNQASAYVSGGASPYPNSADSTFFLRNTASTDGATSLIVLGAQNSSGNGQYSYIGNISVTGAGSYKPAMVFGMSAGSSSYVEQMRLDGDGNLGLGTIVPARRLHVYNSAIRIGPASTPGSPAAGDLYFDLGDANKMKYYDGTAWRTPGDFLSTGNTPMTGALLAYSGSAAAPGITFAGDVSTGIFRPGSGNMSFVTSGTERIRISNAGYLGLGTNVPQNLLHMQGSEAAEIIESFGSIGASVQLRSAGGAVGSPSALTPLSTLGAINFYGHTGSAFSSLPGARIAARSAETYSPSATGTFLAFYTRATGSAESVAPLERLRINDQGNVGIGTSTPAYALEVIGDINASGSVRVSGTVLTSDQRFKRDIEPLDHALEKILHLRGVSYHWRQDEFPAKHFRAERQIGVIAQEVEAQFPEVVDTGADGYKGVNYSALIAPLIEAVKQLHAENASLKSYICEKDPAAKICAN